MFCKYINKSQFVKAPKLRHCIKFKLYGNQESIIAVSVEGELSMNQAPACLGQTLLHVCLNGRKLHTLEDP